MKLRWIPMLAVFVCVLAPAGAAFAASPESKVTDPVPLLELTSSSGARLYTLSTLEANAAVAQHGFTLQAARAGYLRRQPFPGSQALYRLRNAPGARLVTASAGERDALVASGRFTYEGVLGYIAAAPGPGLVRLERYSKSGDWRIVREADGPALVRQGYRRDGTLGFAPRLWVRAGAIYFGMWDDLAKSAIAATKRTYGRDGDPWGGVRDYSGQDPNVPMNRWLWPNVNFSYLKPSIGYYDDSRTETLEKHIAQASGAGLRYFSFYWYWNNQTGHEDIYKGLHSFLRARNRAAMEFSVQVCAHDYAPLEIPVGQFGAAIGTIVDQYLTQPNYLRANDGRPIVEICDTRGIGSGSPADVKAFVDGLRARARAVLGEEILVITNRELGLDIGPYGIQGEYCSARFDTVHGSYREYVETQRAMFASDAPRYVRCVMTNFDERPRYPHLVPDVNRIRYFTDRTLALYRRAIANVRDDMLASRRPSELDNFAVVFAWNEWHEGGILEPNVRDGCGLLNDLRAGLGLTDGAGCVPNPPLPAGPAPAPAPAPPAAPRLDVKVRVGKRLRKKALRVRVRCSMSCSARGAGAARIARRHEHRAKRHGKPRHGKRHAKRRKWGKQMRLRTSRRKLPANRTRTLELRVGKRTRTKITRALRKHRRVRVKVRVRATNSTAPTRTVTRTVRLKRAKPKRHRHKHRKPGRGQHAHGHVTMT